MTKENIIESLNRIHSSLLKVHRALLQLQIYEYQQSQERPLNFQEIIELASSHADFVWLKDLSNMILKIDDYTLDKNHNTTEADLASVKSQVNQILFQTRNPSLFQSQLEKIISQQPAFKTELQELKDFVK